MLGWCRKDSEMWSRSGTRVQGRGRIISRSALSPFLFEAVMELLRDEAQAGVCIHYDVH